MTSRFFDPGSFSGLDEPVRRFFAHALQPGVRLGPGVRLTMAGRIKVGAWLDFDAGWEGDGRSLEWRARAGLGPVRPLRVVDRFADGAGEMEVRMLGRLRVVHAAGEETSRSGAGRAAVEAAVWSPASLLPERGVRWRADSEELIVASWELPPERPEVRLRIDERGAVRHAVVMRWQSNELGYVPCGGEVDAERDFAGLVIASRITVGWGFGTPRYAPFFEAEVLSAEGTADRRG